MLTVAVIMMMVLALMMFVCLLVLVISDRERRTDEKGGMNSPAAAQPNIDSTNNQRLPHNFLLDNLLENEKILITPKLHWVYFIGPFLWCAMVFALLIYGRDFFVETASKNSIVNSFDVVSGQMISESFYKFIFAIGFFTLAYIVIKILKYVNTKYFVTNKRLIIKTGIFSKVSTDIWLDTIEYLQCRRSLPGRILNYGTITVKGMGTTTAGFKKVFSPKAVAGETQIGINNAKIAK